MNIGDIQQLWQVEPIARSRPRDTAPPPVEASAAPDLVAASATSHEGGQ